MVWEKLDALIHEGRLRASIEILNELEKKDDDLFAWCKERQEFLSVEFDDACQLEMSRIMRAYPRLVDTVKGRSGDDPFVIALAGIKRPLMTVVTEESPRRQRIPDVCTAEGIPCISLADMIEQEDWQFG